MTHIPLSLPVGAARPFVWLVKAAHSDSDQPRRQRPEVTPPLVWTPGPWRRWAEFRSMRRARHRDERAGP